MHSSIFRKDEYGVVYSIFKYKGDDRFGIMFADGGYDDFTQDDVDLFLRPINNYNSHMRSYKFKDVLQLVRDCNNGLFDFLKGYTPQ